MPEEYSAQRGRDDRDGGWDGRERRRAPWGTDRDGWDGRDRRRDGRGRGGRRWYDRMRSLPWYYFLPYYRYPKYRCEWFDRYGRCRYYRNRPYRYLPMGKSEEMLDEHMGAEPMLMAPAEDMDYSD